MYNYILIICLVQQLEYSCAKYCGTLSGQVKLYVSHPTLLAVYFNLCPLDGATGPCPPKQSASLILVYIISTHKAVLKTKAIKLFS